MFSLCVLCSCVHMLMCLFSYVHMSMLCLWECMLICACTHACVHICSHGMLCSYVYMLRCADIHLHVHVCSHVHCMFTCVHAHVYAMLVCMHMLTYLRAWFMCSRICLWEFHAWLACVCIFMSISTRVWCLCMLFICVYVHTCVFHDLVCTQLTEPSLQLPLQRFLDSGLHFWALPGYWSHLCALPGSWHSLHLCTWSADSSLGGDSNGGGGGGGSSLYVSGSHRLSRIPLLQIFIKPAVWCHIGFSEPVLVGDLKTLRQQQWYLKGHRRADQLPVRKPWDFT